MKEYKNKNDLLQELDWAEGGLYELISNQGIRGIENYDVPDEVKEMWEEASSLIEDFENLESKIWAELKWSGDE